MAQTIKIYSILLSWDTTTIELISFILIFWKWGGTAPIIFLGPPKFKESFHKLCLHFLSFLSFFDHPHTLVFTFTVVNVAFFWPTPKCKQICEAPLGAISNWRGEFTIEYWIVIRLWIGLVWGFQDLGFLFWKVS